MDELLETERVWPAERKLREMRVLMARQPRLGPDDIYSPPGEAEFRVDRSDPDGDLYDYLPAPDLEVIGRQLINECEEIAHLLEVQVAFLWKRGGGKSHGKAILGKCQKTSGLVAHYSGVTWIIWLAADHAYSFRLTRRQVEAALHHELCHAGEELDEQGEKVPTVYPHDFEGILHNVRRYGAWMEDLKLCRNAWQQLTFDDVASEGIDKVTLTHNGRSVDLTAETGRRARELLAGESNVTHVAQARLGG